MSALEGNGNGLDHAEDEAFTDSADEWELPAHENGDSAPAATTSSSSKLPMHLAGLERELRGDEVPVTFHLPGDGGTVKATFYMGQTVELLKTFLEQERPREMAYDRTSLFLGEKSLMDPLSLSDLPFKANENNDVRVVTK